MKNIVLLIALTFGFLGFGQNGIFTYESVKGNVKSVHVILYKAVVLGEKIEKGEKKLDFIVTFNENAKAISYSFIDKKNVTGAKRFISYNADNQVVQEILYKGIYPAIKTSYVYDGKKNLIEFVSIANMDTIQNIKKYNSDNQNTELVVFRNGKQFEKSTFAYYGKTDKVREQISYESDNRIVSHLQFKYDLAGNKTHEVELDDTGKVNSQITFVYNKDNQLTQKEVFDSQGNLIKKYTTTYNAKKLPIEYCEYWNNGTFMRKFTYTYNKYDNLLVKEESGYAANKDSFEYVYDNQGNWIKLILSQKDVPITLAERTIEYY